MPKTEVRQLVQDQPYILIIITDSIEEAITKRQENGLRLSAYHGLPITIEIWTNVAEDGEVENMVYVDAVTTSVVFSWEDDEYQD